MSAEVLRRAASLMRERAEAATPGEAARTVACPACQSRKVDTSWVAMDASDFDSLACRACGHCWAGELGGLAYGSGWSVAQSKRSSEHIASWHPAVALAVADWLESEARWVDIGAANSPQLDAIAVARAYLGECA